MMDPLYHFDAISIPKNQNLLGLTNTIIIKTRVTDQILLKKIKTCLKKCNKTIDYIKNKHHSALRKTRSIRSTM